jgi:hypothetical protein
VPPLRSIAFVDGVLTLDDFRGGGRVLATGTIPPAQNTPAKVETWINNTWVPANITGYQLVVKVFAITPTVQIQWMALDIGEPVPPNWWVE